MEPEQAQQEQDFTPEPKQSALNTVTPLSKYLAMGLFVLMPFIGGYVGYRMAPEKVVEIEVVAPEITEKQPTSKSSEQPNEDEFISIGGDYYISKSDITSKEKIFYKNNYWTGTTSPDGGYIQREYISYVEIPEADLDSFEVDSNHTGYAKDENNVYFFWRTPFESSPNDGVRIMTGADPETFEAKIVRLFEVSQGNTYQGWISRDKDNVYYRNEVIEGAEPDTYVVGENVSINYDSDDVFLWHKKIPLADPKTYEVVLDTSAAGRGTVFGRDKERCYKDYEIFSCAELPTTFQEAAAI